MGRRYGYEHDDDCNASLVGGSASQGTFRQFRVKSPRCGAVWWRPCRNGASNFLRLPAGDRSGHVRSYFNGTCGMRCRISMSFRMFQAGYMILHAYACMHACKCHIARENISARREALEVIYEVVWIDWFWISVSERFAPEAAWTYMQLTYHVLTFVAGGMIWSGAAHCARYQQGLEGVDILHFAVTTSWSKNREPYWIKRWDPYFDSLTTMTGFLSSRPHGTPAA